MLRIEISDAYLNSKRDALNGPYRYHLNGAFAALSRHLNLKVSSEHSPGARVPDSPKEVRAIQAEQRCKGELSDGS